MEVENGAAVVCLSTAPTGYQNPSWFIAFAFVPVAIALLAVVVSVCCRLYTARMHQQDLFLAISTYGFAPQTAKYNTSTLSDVVFYAQFIFVTGALNLNYPRFYALFTADFAWSWLLFSTTGTKQLLTNVIRPCNSGNEAFTGGCDDRNGAVLSRNMIDLSHAMDIDNRGLFLTCILFFSFLLAAVTLTCLLFWLVWEMLALSNPYKYGGQRAKIGNVNFGTMKRKT